ncbi:hypothetical protein JG688_00016975, partial [Phytophthora aleatoria]
LVGCASHRYNLAVQRFLREHEGLLEDVNALVGQLRTKKNGARLRQHTELVAVKRNTTRWSSTFKMLKRYLEIKAAAKQVETVEDLVPCARVHRKIEKFCEQMRALESVNKKLQSKETTIADARVLFDGVLQLYPMMKSHLSKEVHIVHLPDFENSIVKHYRQASEGHSCDVLLFHVPPKSNRCERLFSQAKMVLTPHRSALPPNHFEMIMFFKVNRQYWDHCTVVTAEALLSNQQPAQ